MDVMGQCWKKKGYPLLLDDYWQQRRTQFLSNHAEVLFQICMASKQRQQQATTGIDDASQTLYCILGLHA